MVKVYKEPFRPGHTDKAGKSMAGVLEARISLLLKKEKFLPSGLQEARSLTLQRRQPVKSKIEQMLLLN